MPGKTTRLPYTTSLLGGLETPNGKQSERTVLENYTTSNLTLKIVKVLTKVVGNMR